MIFVNIETCNGNKKKVLIEPENKLYDQLDQFFPYPDIILTINGKYCSRLDNLRQALQKQRISTLNGLSLKVLNIYTVMGDYEQMETQSINFQQKQEQPQIETQDVAIPQDQNHRKKITPSRQSQRRQATPEMNENIFGITSISPGPRKLNNNNQKGKNFKIKNNPKSASINNPRSKTPDSKKKRLTKVPQKLVVEKILKNKKSQCFSCSSQIDNVVIRLDCKHNYHEICFQNVCQDQLNSAKTILTCICKQRFKLDLLNQLQNQSSIQTMKCYLYLNQLEEIRKKYASKFNECHWCCRFFFYNEQKFYPQTLFCEICDKYI